MARPKRQFTDEEIQQMEEYALDGCQNNTIATIMNIANSTLIRRFGKLLTKKRCERKQRLRLIQTNLALSNPAMAIFLGKNELGQVDKRVIETEAAEQKKLDEAEAAEARKIANILNLEEARKGKVG
jgi:hypothetical protein